MVLGGKDQLRVRRLRKGEAPLEVLVEPERPRHGELRCEAMVHVRGKGVPDVLMRDQPAGAVGVVHDPVEVVGRSQPEQRGLDVRSIRLETDGRIEQLHVAVRRLHPHLRQQWPGFGAKTRSADGRGRGLHPVVRPGNAHGQVAAHRVSVNAQAAGIDFRLLLQERQGASGSQREHVPVVVPGRLERIEVLLAGLEVEVTRHVLLRGIDRSPIRVRVALPGVLHFSAAPIDRETGVTPLGMELDLVQKGSLAPAVNVQ